MKYENLFKTFLDPISCVTFSPDGKSIISGAGDNSIKVFDMESKKEAYHFVEVQEGKLSLKFRSSIISI